MLRNNKYSEFIALLDSLDVSAVRRFIVENPDLNYDHLEPDGRSTLAVLAHLGTLRIIPSELVNLFLEATKPDGTPLIDASQIFAEQNRSLHLIDYISAKNLKVIVDRPSVTSEHLSRVDAGGQNVIMRAVYVDRFDNFELLLNHPKLPRTCLTHVDDDGRNIFALAALAYEPQFVTALLDHKHIPSSCFTWKNSTGGNALINALRHPASGWQETIPAILKHKNMPATLLSQRDEEGSTPLMYAVSFGNSEIVAAMLSHKKISKSCLGEFNTYGNNVLMAAILGKNLYIIKLILDDERMSMRTLQHKNKAGFTAVDIANTYCPEAVALIKRCMKEHKRGTPRREANKENKQDVTVGESKETTNKDAAADLTESPEYAKAVEVLYDRIAELDSYADKLKKAGATTKAPIAKAFAAELKKDVDKFVNDNNRDWKKFENNFLEKLDGAKNLNVAALAKQRVNWSTLIKNVGLALTGIGALYIGAHLAVTKIKHHHARFPFSQRQTTSMQKVDDIRKAVKPSQKAK